MKPSKQTRATTNMALTLSQRVRRYSSIGALMLLLSGCGVTHRVSEGEPASTQEALSEPVPFSRQAAQRYTPDDWPEVLRADVYLPETLGEQLRPAALVVHGGG